MQKIDLYKTFFTHEADYYAEKLVRFEKGEKYTFNFWAGVFGLTWFCYRKMYWQSIIIFFATAIFAVITGLAISIINPYNVANYLYSQFVIWPLSFVVLGYLGNNLYLKKSMKIVEELSSNESNLSEIKEKGGTSMTAALVCGGLLILLQVIS